MFSRVVSEFFGTGCSYFFIQKSSRCIKLSWLTHLRFKIILHSRFKIGPRLRFKIVSHLRFKILPHLRFRRVPRLSLTIVPRLKFKTVQHLRSKKSSIFEIQKSSKLKKYFFTYFMTLVFFTPLENIKNQKVLIKSEKLKIFQWKIFQMVYKKTSDSKCLNWESLTFYFYI